MNSRTFLRKTVIVTVVFQLAFGQAVFAATTDKDFTLDDGTGDSPSVILTDADDNTLTITKADSGEAVIANDEGGIDFKPSSDADNYIQFITNADICYINWMGISGYTNPPGIRVDPATGKVEFREEDNASWTTLESISGSSTSFGGLSDTTFTSPAAGDVVYFDGTNWLNLGIGTTGQVLAVNSGATAPVWSAAAAGNLAGLSDTTLTGITQGDVLYYNGTAWVNLGPGTAGQVL